MSRTIIQCYFPIEDFQGFGAYLSSTLYLHDYCVKNNYNLLNSYEYHSSFNKIFKILHTEYIGVKQNNVPIIQTFSELEEYIATQSSNTIYISFYGGNTDILFNRNKYLESINFVKNHCLNLSEEYNNKINLEFEKNKITKHNYIAIHLRVGDEDLVQKEGIYKPLLECFLKNFEMIILPLLDNDNIVIISDNITLKKLLKDLYTHNNLYIMDTIPYHTGIQKHVNINSNYTNRIDDTVLDFFILGYSKQIIIISAQHQNPVVSSFFSRYCGCIYNIPTKIKKIQLEIFNNKTSYEVK